MVTLFLNGLTCSLPLAVLLFNSPVVSEQGSHSAAGSPSQSTLIAQFRPDRPDFFEEGSFQFEQEIQRLEQQQTNPILTVEDDLQQWQPLILRQAGISVWLPQGVASQETKTLETNNGTLSFSVVTVTSGGSRFVTAYSDPLMEADLANSDTLFASVRDAVVENTAFELESDRPLDSDSLTTPIEVGRELTLSDGDETITFRLYLANQRLYVLGVSQPDVSDSETELSEAALLFFDSLQFLP